MAKVEPNATPDVGDPKVEIRLKSALPGRERWEVDNIYQRPHLASRLHGALVARTGIDSVKANPTTGRLLVRFDPAALPDGAGATIRSAVEGLNRHPEAEISTSVGAAEKPIRRILEKTAARQHLTTTGPLLSVLSTLAPFVATWFSSRLFDTVLDASGESTSGPPRSLWGLAALIGVTDLLGVVLEYHDRKHWKETSSAVEHQLRSSAFKKAVNLDMATFDAQSAVRLRDTILSDSGRVAAFVHNGPGTIARLITVNGLAIGATVAARPVLLPILLLPAATVYGSQRYFRNWAGPIYFNAAEEGSRLNQLVSGSLIGITTVKSYTAEGYETERVSRQSLESIAAGEAAAGAGQAFGTFMHMFCAASILLLLTKARADVSQLLVPRDRFFFLQQVSPKIITSIFELDGIFGAHQGATTAAERMLAVLETRQQVESGSVRLSESKVQGEIRFDRVSFGYVPDVPVLRDLSLRVGPGETIGIVGSTGAGKSTVIKLLLRFYAEQDGETALDGDLLKDLHLAGLRRSIAYVSQDTYLFDGTIADNIRVGAPHASHQEVVAAARSAAAHEFIERLPKGYETPVGERGSLLSSGQRQRIAIARAMIKNAPVLVLDEATASLDNETEAAIQQSLEEFASGRSMVLIAHRLSTVRNADRIYVIDEGKVLEQGGHDDLLELDGLYASLWRVQTGVRLVAADS